MQPSVGRIVHYRLQPWEAAEIMRRRAETHGYQAMPVSIGTALPAIVVEAHGGSMLGLHVLLNGPDSFWTQSGSEGEGDGMWSWPPREEG